MNIPKLIDKISEWYASRSVLYNCYLECLHGLSGDTTLTVASVSLDITTPHLDPQAASCEFNYEFFIVPNW